MSEQAARNWLSSHHDVIPALECHHRRALETLEDHSRTLGDLADIIAIDPGMSVSLYHQVNSKLGNSGKQPVASVHSALGLLGDSAIADLILQHKLLNETGADRPRRQSYHQLISRAQHMLAQLEHFASFQGIGALNEVRSAALLHNIGEYCACLFDHSNYLKYQEKFKSMGSDANSAKPVFGFDFHELGRIYAEKSCLPELLVESLEENLPTGRKARLIQLAADLSHQAEVGWYHASMKATEEVCAAYLNQSLPNFGRHLQQVAIEAARHSHLDDVMPAAARLILEPDREMTAEPIASRKQNAQSQSFEHRVKAMLASPQASQSQLIDLLLNHLHDEIHLNRVVLMLLSSDKRKLGTRTGKGIDEHSPIRKLVIDIANASLLKSILAKPQALWIEADSYRKYEASLPGTFKAAFLHESFYLMSLHVGAKAIGLIFADRSLGVNKLDKVSYVKFKSAILLTGKALSYLAKQKQPA